MSATDRQADETVQAAAAVLVLIEGSSAPVAATLRGMAEPQDLARLERALTTGERAARARAMAGPLGRIALALDPWRLG